MKYCILAALIASAQGATCTVNKPFYSAEVMRAVNLAYMRGKDLPRIEITQTKTEGDLGRAVSTTAAAGSFGDANENDFAWDILTTTASAGANKAKSIYGDEDHKFSLQIRALS